jgi:N-acetylglucosaminyldiphosphoundecaprenol N-acetyl-beta-D-mannosaminyltransferase
MSETARVERLEDGAIPATPPAALGLDDFDRDVWCVLGLPFDRADVPAAADAVANAARTGRRLSFVTPNTNWLVRARSDKAARAQILNADISLADGAPVAAIAKLLGAPLPGRAAGSDLFEALKARPAIAGRRLRVFFFGGRDGAADAAAAALRAGSFGVEAAGALNPGHGDLETMSRPEIIREINSARPDFVLVALGAAKGQAWIERNLAALSAPVVAHLGAVVDFTAGTIRRAPKWVARAGLEWAWRIKEERSLWRRYAADGAALAALLVGNVLPQMFLGRASSKVTAAAAVERRGAAVVIRLSGDMTSDSLAPARRAFRAAAAARADVILDVAGVGGCDRAFLGLVLMLEKAVLNAGATLSAAGVRPHMRRLLALNGMNYAEASPDAASPDKTSRPVVAPGRHGAAA